jgi:hypothetical protein
MKSFAVELNDQARRRALQARLSSALLDLAEFTGWEWWIFKDLKEIRADQRAEVAFYRDRHRIPAWASIRAERISLAEIIPAEKFGVLKECILTALPTIREWQPDFDRSFRQTIQGSFRGGFMRLGSIVSRKGNSAMPGDSISDRLPAGVKSVNLVLRKLLPSFAVFCIDVSLDAHMTAELIRLTETRPLPTFRITQLSPWKGASIGWHQSGTDSRKQVAGWLASVAQAVARFLQLDRLGNYKDQEIATHNRPIVTYSLVTGPDSTQETKDWIKDNQQWLDGIGVETIPFSLYTNGKAVFAWSTDTWRSDLPLPHHILVMRNRCGHDLSRTIEEAVHSMSVAVGLLDWLQTSIYHVEELREQAFRLIRSPRRLGRRGLSDHFRLSNHVQLQMILVDQLAAETENELTSALIEVGGSSFTLVDLGVANFIPADLNAALAMNIERFVKVLRSQASYVHRGFSEFLSLQNMETSFRVQRLVAALTIITLVVAILAVPSIVTWFEQHVRFWHTRP